MVSFQHSGWNLSLRRGGYSYNVSPLILCAAMPVIQHTSIHYTPFPVTVWFQPVPHTIRLFKAMVTSKQQSPAQRAGIGVGILANGNLCGPGKEMVAFNVYMSSFAFSFFIRRFVTLRLQHLAFSAATLLVEVHAFSTNN